MIEAMADDAAPTDVDDVLAQLANNAVDVLAPLWWLWSLLAAVALGRLLKAVYERQRLTRSGIREIDSMDGPTFERYLGTMFRRLGYEVENVGRSGGDYGGDLVIGRNGARTVVQAKRYGGRRVGIKAVQEAHAARTMYQCAEAMVVTNNAFTQQAETLARTTGVELFGRDELIRALLEARKTGAPAEAPGTRAVVGAREARVLTVGDASAFCARCGAGVSDKVRDYCRARAERFGGLVYCYTHQRGFRRSAG